MKTGWPIEARLSLVQELYQAISNHKRIVGNSGPWYMFKLTKAILEDSKLRCNNKSLITQVLKKSPIWQRVLPFLEYDEVYCRQKGCNHRPEQHSTKGCDGRTYHYNYMTGASHSTACTCKQYAVKTF